MLSALEPAYFAATTVRNCAFDWGLRPAHRVPVPVISVGNVTTGGTGKTPLVAWVAQQLLQHDRRPALLSRGYRSLDHTGNDELRVLNLLCPGVPHVQQADRVAGACRLILEHQCRAIVLDDAFQHRRIHRDLDLVLIDALNPFGYGHLLPRGLLRESLRGLRRADVVLITRGEAVPEATLADLQQQLRHWTAAPIVRTRFVPIGLRTPGGESIPLVDCSRILAAETPGAFCGIGNPVGFEATLSAVLQRSLTAIPFADHHHYTPADVQTLQQQQVDAWFTTLKDLVKLPSDAFGDTPVYAVDIGVDFIDPPAPILERLQSLGS